LDVIDDYNSDSVDYSAYGSSSGELEGSDSSPSSEEDSSDDASARHCNGGSLHLCPHSASINRYREIKHHDSYIDDSSSESSKGSITYSSNEEEDASYNIESSDEISNNEADVGSAKQFYIEEKCRGSVLKEKKREHIPLLRAMAIGLEDDERGRKAVGDSGYSCRDLSDRIVTTRWIHSKQFKKWIARVKSRQESLFLRMKAFQVLGGVFRHSKGGTDAKISLHKACTEAVLTLIAYDLEEYPLFDVDRSDVSFE
jgi:hypothetical protein